MISAGVAGFAVALLLGYLFVALITESCLTAKGYGCLTAKDLWLVFVVLIALGCGVIAAAIAADRQKTKLRS